MEQYKRPNPKHNLVFPDLGKLDNLTDSFVVQSYIKARIKASNEQLPNVAKAAKIEKDITIHIARHTFGNLSGDSKAFIEMLKTFKGINAERIFKQDAAMFIEMRHIRKALKNVEKLKTGKLKTRSASELLDEL